MLTLYLTATDRGYPSARWATYRQWASLGAQVRKGERGTLGIFWKVTDPTPDLDRWRSYATYLGDRRPELYATMGRRPTR